jgi:hypothetical protein
MKLLCMLLPVLLAAQDGTPRPVVEAPAAITARFIPLSLASSRPRSGPAAEAGTWHVEVCNRGAAPVQVHRALILETAPNLRYLPEEFQEAVLAQRTKRSPWAIVGTVLSAAGSAAAVAGFARENRQLAAAGSGVALGVQILTAALKPQVDAAPAYSLPRMLPELVAVPAGGCVEHNILAARLPGAAVIGPNPVRLP